MIPLLLFLSWSCGSGGTPEERCLELGDACICNEPLNVSQDIPAKGFNNPADSQRKQCPGDQGDGRSVYLKGGGRTVSERLMPPANRVDWVWAKSGHGVSYLSGDRNSLTPDTRRVCARVYMRYSSTAVGDEEDYSVSVGGTTCLPGDVGFPDRCEHNKGMHILGGAFAQAVINERKSFHMTWTLKAREEGREKGRGKKWIRDRKLPHRGATFGIPQCMDTWCRFELCVAGNLGAGEGIYPDARIVRLSTGETMRFYDPKGPANGARPTTKIKVWMPNLFREFNRRLKDTNTDPAVNQSSKHQCRGTRFFSHALQAQWNRDEGQFIGPAYEVEARGSDTPPPPTGTNLEP